MCKLAANGRRFFITEAGFVGVTCRGVEEGDKIVLFLGGASPFIIRECQSVPAAFNLVGTAYVHGIMDGEAMRLEETTDFLLV